MYDYEVIVRIPVRARDPETAHADADMIVDDIRMNHSPESYMAGVECTGPAEEE